MSHISVCFRSQHEINADCSRGTGGEKPSRRKKHSDKAKENWTEKKKKGWCFATTVSKGGPFLDERAALEELAKSPERREKRGDLSNRKVLNWCASFEEEVLWAAFNPFWGKLQTGIETYFFLQRFYVEICIISWSNNKTGNIQNFHELKSNSWFYTQRSIIFWKLINEQLKIVHTRCRNFETIA